MARPVGGVALQHPSNRGLALDPKSRPLNVKSGTYNVTFTVWIDQSKPGSEQLMTKLILKPVVRGLDGKSYPSDWGATKFNRVNPIDGFFSNFNIRLPVRKAGPRLDGGTFEPLMLLDDGSGLTGDFVASTPCPITFVSGYPDHVFFAIAPVPPAYTVTSEHDHNSASVKGTIGGDAGPVKLGAEVNSPNNTDKTTVAGPPRTRVTLLRLVETRNQGQSLP